MPAHLRALEAGKSQVECYTTEPTIRKRGLSQVQSCFLDKALCPKQMRFLACGRRQECLSTKDFKNHCLVPNQPASQCPPFLNTGVLFCRTAYLKLLRFQSSVEFATILFPTPYLLKGFKWEPSRGIRLRIQADF